MTKSGASRFFLWLLGTALPLALGIIGLLALIVDLFGPFNLPNDYEDEVLLAAASVVLLAYFAQNQRQTAYDDGHNQLLTKVEQTLSRVDARVDLASIHR